MNALRFFISLLVIAASSSCFGQFSETLVKQAERGIVTAQIELAECYLEGNGVEKSIEERHEELKEALKWYEKAAEKNNVEAMVACGDLLCNTGDGWVPDFEPDYVRGMNWYRKAASKGNKKAKEFIENFAIAKEEISHECPFEWLPCDEDFDKYPFLKKNEDHIKKEYGNKNPIAAYYLAILSYGNEDFSSAVKYLTEIFPTVMDESKSFEDIFDWGEEYRDIESIFQAKVFSLLGWCYEHGQGVEQDYTKAAEYYLTEFDLFSVGLSMIPRVRGAYCYKKAGLYEKFIDEAKSLCVYYNDVYTTKYNVPCLQLELAEMYKTGEGVTQNKKQALEIYESIVDKRKGFLDMLFYGPEFCSYPDVGRAAYRASQMYKNGEGCKVDEEMAKLYFEIALKYGDENAWYEHKNK